MAVSAQPGCIVKRVDEFIKGERLFVASTLVVAIMQVAVFLWRTRSTYFITDDFFNFIVYREFGLRNYLFRDMFGHITPLYRLAQALVFRVGGAQFAMLRLIILVLSLIPSVFTMLIARRLRLPTGIGAAAALLIAVLPQGGQAELWWSNALLVVPGLASVFVSLWFLVGASGKGPTASDARWAAAVFAAGLGFYDKDLFAGALFFGVVLSLRLEGRTLFGAALKTIHDLRFVIAAAVLWALVLVFLRETSPPAPSLAVAAEFMWLAWADAVVGAMLGLGDTGWRIATPTASLLGAEVVLSLIVGWTVIRGGWRALVVWAAVLVYSILTIALTARMRAGPFGADFGKTLRYAVEPAAFIVLAGLVALAGVKLKRPWIITTFLCILAANVVVATSIPQVGDPTATRRYVQNIRRSVATLRVLPDAIVLDSEVPDVIMPGWMAPLNVQSKFLPLFGGRAHFTAERMRANWAINAEGALQALP